MSGGAPAQHAGDFSVYGIVDQMLWRSRTRELDSFLRIMGSPDNRNLISFYLDAGLALQGPFDGRKDDILGLGVAYARVSPQARRCPIAMSPLSPARRFRSATMKP